MIDPRHLSVLEWTAQVTPGLSAYGPIPRLTDETRWPLWAALVIALPGLSALHPPRPEGFQTWQTWAFAFNQSIYRQVSPN